MSDGPMKVSPMYFVADESYSMVEVTGEMNIGLKELLDAMHLHPYAAALVRFSIIGFSDNAIEHLSLADVRDLKAMPVLGAYNGTSYRSIFIDLQRRIEADVKTLRADNRLVLRPIIFFLTDGQPNDEDWQTPLTALKDEGFAYRPNILAFGIGEARADTILAVASKPRWAFAAAQGVDTGAALAKFMEELSRTVVKSAQALAQGTTEIPVEEPDGFMRLDILPNE